MADVITQEYEELTLTISLDDGTNWSKICGITNATVTRTANIETSEIPDCDDESLPHGVKKRVRSIEVSVSGEGLWAQQSNDTILTAFYGGTEFLARITHGAAAAGDVEIENGPAIFASIGTVRTKGQSCQASVELHFSGRITLTDKAA